MDARRWAIIESLYDAALAKEPSERSSYLAHACREHPELQAEVESLLRCAGEELNSPLEDCSATPTLREDVAFTQTRVGDKLGPYEIIGAIGAGGMGEVYRAHDTKLDRDVAIKVLPKSFARDSERVARFKREGKVLAALNHPNIAQIYGLEDCALIMQLVEGPTLAERIAQGALPLEEALGIAQQIADALEAAHEKGIIHRDLKPSNVKITLAGVVKVLDFGLAAVAQCSTADGNPSISPTLTLDYAPTRSGVIMGTAAYMSPEQASGKPVDKRSDIWSFGVVLWEMLTSKRLFAGETISHTLAAVLTKEPDLKQVPARLRKLLRACLQKEAKLRLQTIGDWRLLLEDSPIEDGAIGKNRIPWIAAAVLAVVALALGFVSYRHLTEERLRVVKLLVPPPEKATFASTSPPAVSPDGRHLAFVATSGGKDRLWVRDLDSLTARLLQGTEGASYPFWSPDSRVIAFFAEDKLKKIDVAGGPVLSLCNAAPFGGSWNKNNVIVFEFSGAPIFRVPAAGGTPTPVTTLDAPSGEWSHAYPWFLPDGHHFLYSSVRCQIGVTPCP